MKTHLHQLALAGVFVLAAFAAILCLGNIGPATADSNQNNWVRPAFSAPVARPVQVYLPLVLKSYVSSTRK